MSTSPTLYYTDIKKKEEDKNKPFTRTPRTPVFEEEEEDGEGEGLPKQTKLHYVVFIDGMLMFFSDRVVHKGRKILSATPVHFSSPMVRAIKEKKTFVQINPVFLGRTTSHDDDAKERHRPD